MRDRNLKSWGPSFRSALFRSVVGTGLALSSLLGTSGPGSAQIISNTACYQDPMKARAEGAPFPTEQQHILIFNFWESDAEFGFPLSFRMICELDKRKTRQIISGIVTQAGCSDDSEFANYMARVLDMSPSFNQTIVSDLFGCDVKQKLPTNWAQFCEVVDEFEHDYMDEAIEESYERFLMAFDGLLDSAAQQGCTSEP